MADMAGFQRRVAAWCVECFGETTATDAVERNWRFLEEALELGFDRTFRSRAALISTIEPGPAAGFGDVEKFYRLWLEGYD